MRFPPRNVFGKAELSAPSSEAELLLRAAALESVTVMELADRLSAPMPSDPTRDKGWVGQLIEAALGATAGNEAHPDFPGLGVELKTMPLDRAGRPRESTFVCSLDLLELAEVPWERSRPRHKLARVLFVPVEGDPGLRLGARRIGTPFLWIPTAAEDAVLREDFEHFAGRIGAGEVDAIGAGEGRYLQMRPKGRSRRDRTRAPGPGGTTLETQPRGLYLRPRFTEGLLGASVRNSNASSEIRPFSEEEGEVGA